MLKFNTVNLQGHNADLQLKSEMAKLAKQDNAASVDQDPRDLVVELHSDAGTSKSFRYDDNSRALVKDVTPEGTTYTDFSVPTEENPETAFGTQVTKTPDGTITATWLHSDGTHTNMLNEPMDPADAKNQFTESEYSFNSSEQLGRFQPF